MVRKTSIVIAKESSKIYQPASPSEMRTEYAFGMDINQIRKKNFDALLKEFQDRMEARGLKFRLVDFAEAYGLAPKHASNMKGGHRGIGDDVARRMEERHEPPLPLGWMDTLHESRVTDPKEEALIDLIRYLYKENPEDVYRAISRMMRDKGKKQ